MNRAFSGGVLGLLLLVFTGCDRFALRPSADPARTAAAAWLTKRYATSRFAHWKVRARPAGIRCDVLLIETSVLMENAMAETVQYGAGSAEIYEGGTQRYAVDRNFHGVAIHDGGDAKWFYDIKPEDEEKALTPCR